MSIIGWFKEKFGKTPEKKLVPPSGPKWIPAAESPFGIEVLDCSCITQGMVSMTGDPSVAAKFGELRADSGVSYRGQEPDDCQTVVCELIYPAASALQEGPVFKAEMMEDKWDIYLYDSQLYFCRSWSGVLAYRATIRSAADKLCVTQIDYAKPRAEEAVDAIRDVDYLIKSHLYGALVPHPFPRNAPRHSEKLAYSSFSRFGRRCRFGTYENTLRALLKMH